MRTKTVTSLASDAANAAVYLYLLVFVDDGP